MLKRIKNKLEYTLKNNFSWKTKRHIIVFESDDWGTIRTASKKAYDKLLGLGVGVDQSYYCKNDALESEGDLTALFEVLASVKDMHGRGAKFTANCLMANPDFAKIRASDFKEYHYEPVQETFAHYPAHAQCFSLWKEGDEHQLFHPQFHGREHVNVTQWLKGLQGNLVETRLAFDCNMFEICLHASREELIRPSYLEALAAYTQPQRAEIDAIVKDGLRMFYENFGFKSESFIAPNYVWNSELEATLAEQGIRYIQGYKYQHEVLRDTDFQQSLKVHYTGQKNALGQIYLTRNCNFEPTSQPGFDWVDRCLAEISAAFKGNRPAIVNTHRVNYIGYLNEENRSKNLKSLLHLLAEIKKRWPDVEFMSSDELGRMIQFKEEIKTAG